MIDTTTLTDAVNAYIEHGATPFPLPDRKKFPPPCGVTGHTKDLTQDEIRAFWEGVSGSENVGIRVPDNVIVIDVDHYGEKTGADTLKALENELGELPPTWSSTRRGADSVSRKYFFSVPTGKRWKSPGKDIDIIQHTHRYAVVFPSVVDGLKEEWYGPDGQPCEIPSFAALPALPESWVDRLQTGHRTTTEKAPQRGYKEALTWLKSRVFAGNSRNPHTFEWEEGSRYDSMNSDVLSLVNNAVHRGHSGLLDDLTALRDAYVAEVGEDRAGEFERSVVGAVSLVEGEIASGKEPKINWRERFGAEPLGEDYALPDFGDLLARQAADYREKLIGEEIEVDEEEAILAALEEFEAFQSDAYREKQTRKIGSWRDRAMSGAWLDAQEFPELQWTVPGLIPEGYGVIVAPPKAGKSWFVANIGLAAAGGGKALGHIDVPQRPVLYLALEDGPRRLQDRYRKLTGGAPIPEALESITEASRDEALTWIEEFATEFAEQRPLIILDTLGKIMGHKSSNQSAYAHDYEEGSRLKRIAAVMPGGTLLVVHHTNKGQHDDFQDAVSGTQGIAGAADFTMHLARKRKSPQGFLSITGRDVTENEYAVTFQDNGLWTLDGGTLKAAAEAVEEARAEDKRNNLPTAQGQSLQILRKAGDEGMTATEFAAKEGISPDTARKRLNRMADDGVISKTADKRYKAPEFPRSTPLVRQAST